MSLPHAGNNFAVIQRCIKRFRLIFQHFIESSLYMYRLKFIIFCIALETARLENILNIIKSFVIQLCLERSLFAAWKRSSLVELAFLSHSFSASVCWIVQHQIWKPRSLMSTNKAAWKYISFNDTTGFKLSKICCTLLNNFIFNTVIINVIIPFLEMQKKIKCNPSGKSLRILHLAISK